MGSISEYIGPHDRMRRYLTEEDMLTYYRSWVKKNGIPKLEQGCVNCAELVCLNNCLGIMDSRVKKIKL